MSSFSTRQAAKKLRIPAATLAHYIRVGKIPKPKSFTSGNATLHIWTEDDIECVRKLLPKIANGRKTRYQKLREKRKAQVKSPVPRKIKKK